MSVVGRAAGDGVQEGVIGVVTEPKDGMVTGW